MIINIIHYSFHYPLPYQFFIDHYHYHQHHHQPQHHSKMLSFIINNKQLSTAVIQV